MKTFLSKIVLLLLLNVAAMGMCRAQDFIDYTQVGLMKADYDHRAVLYIGNTQKAAIAILGTPTSQSTYFSEIRNVNLTVLNYGASKLYFDADGLVLYDIADASIAVGKNYATSFRVGTNRGSNSVFHGLAVKATAGKSRNLNYGAIALASLKSGGDVLDFGVEVLFDGSGNVFDICLLETN
ncbi:hypothetical protein KB206_00410 [Microvirga sp. STS02]|uniref:hypothetical protein n=1 Tax=Hymenobacter negativus TaxID=2795026 RepID=UPI0018DC5D6E|nr:MULTISPECIES: hypothetical protein [Bacteria]MBH8567327.1 hypothetical protein [Hymenobacter negativus]MBR7207059.1 hypothetical protein [Microvirga sp. STS02]